MKKNPDCECGHTVNWHWLDYMKNLGDCTIPDCRCRSYRPKKKSKEE